MKNDSAWNNFIENCHSLKEINLTACKNLKSVGSLFLYESNPNCKIICTEKQKPIILDYNKGLLNKIVTV